MKIRQVGKNMRMFGTIPSGETLRRGVLFYDWFSDMGKKRQSNIVSHAVVVGNNSQKL